MAAHQMPAHGMDKGLYPYPRTLFLKRGGSTPHRIEKGVMPKQRLTSPATREEGTLQIIRMIGEKRAREMIPPKMMTFEQQLEAFKNPSRQGAQPNNAYSYKILPGE
jgi:hypothetical protein